MKIKMIALLWLSCSAFTTQAQFAKKLLNRVVTTVAKVGGPMLTSTTADLTSVVPNVYYMNNLHPSAVESIDQSFYNNWKEGGGMVGIMFTSKNSAGMNKIDGEVTINGVKAEYVSVGLYVAFFDNDTQPKVVEVVSSNGQKSSFTINPPKQAIKIVSINGKADNVAIDLTQDVVLELENVSESPDVPVMVSLAINVLGLKTFYPVGYFKPASKIVIPAAYFRNINIPPGNTKVVGYNYKGSFFKVDRASVDQASGISGVYPAVEYANIYYDGKFLEVTVPPVVNPGLTAKGIENFPTGEVTYEAYKPNAFTSRPFKQIKTIGIASFAIRGTTSFYENKENKFQGTETTKTASFPQLPNEVWDNLLTNFYTDFMAILQAEFPATVLPVEKVTATPAYQSMSAFSKDDANTTVDFTRTYRDTKLLSTFVPISDAYGINNVESRIMNESGANALLKVTIDVRLTFEGSKAAMVPVLGVELNGVQNGPTMSTKYFTATVSGQGVPFKNKTTITPQMLEDVIVRKADLLAAFRKAVQEIKKQEAANGDYTIIWPTEK